MPFIKGQSGNSKGRPRGTTKKPAPTISAETKQAAINALDKAVRAGEPWAIELVINKIVAVNKEE